MDVHISEPWHADRTTTKLNEENPIHQQSREETVNMKLHLAYRLCADSRAWVRLRAVLFSMKHFMFICTWCNSPTKKNITKTIFRCWFCNNIFWIEWSLPKGLASSVACAKRWRCTALKTSVWRINHVRTTRVETHNNNKEMNSK